MSDAFKLHFISVCSAKITRMYKSAATWQRLKHNIRFLSNLENSCTDSLEQNYTIKSHVMCSITELQIENKIENYRLHFSWNNCNFLLTKSMWTRLMLSAKYFEHIPVQNDVNQNIYVAMWEQRSRFHSDDILTSKSIPNRPTTMQLH